MGHVPDSPVDSVNQNDTGMVGDELFHNLRFVRASGRTQDVGTQSPSPEMQSTLKGEDGSDLKQQGHLHSGDGDGTKRNASKVSPILVAILPLVILSRELRFLLVRI